MTTAATYLQSAVVNRWKEQFQPEDRWVAERLLDHFRYYDADTLLTLLQQLHRSLVDEYREQLTGAFFIPCGYVASSGAAVSYLYRRANKLQEDRFISAEDLSAVDDKATLIIFIDDFIGSGDSAIRLWQEIAAPFQKRNGSKLVLACAVGYETAIQSVVNKTSFHVICADIVPDSERPFSSNSKIFPGETERVQAEEIVRRYSSRLELRAPFGYADVQGLVSFFFNTPDNTLPIFWSTANGWIPLFPFGTTAEDYESSLQFGRGPILPALIHSSQQAINELEILAKSNIAPQIAMEVLQECQSLLALATLIPIIEQLKMPANVVHNLIQIIRKLRHALHEQQPVRTALLVIPSAAFRESGLVPFVAPADPLNVRDDSAVEALAELVNGFEGSVAISPEGQIYGNVMYLQGTDDLVSLVPERLRAAAITSRLLEALVIVFAGDGRVSVLFGGNRILSYRQATWHVPPNNIHARLSKIERQLQVANDILLHTYQAVLDMSDLGYGAIFLIGDEAEISKISDVPTSHWKWGQLRIEPESRRQLIALAKQDGATLIARDGAVIRNGVILRPPADVTAEIDPSAGARHSSAAKTTVVSSSTSFVVSVDGKITCFLGGKAILHDIT
jgi:DNA integrity scanning protein DisA with diadenylate cyclase activity